MSRFDEEPDGDPHGECALEITRLQSERDQYYKCFLAEQAEHAKAISDRDKAQRELIACAERVARLEAALNKIVWIKECGTDVLVDGRLVNATKTERDAMYEVARQALGGAK